MRQLPYSRTVWKISLPTSVAGRVELRLSNIEGTGPQYGARSKLLVHLLNEWLDADILDATEILEKAKQRDKLLKQLEDDDTETASVNGDL